MKKPELSIIITAFKEEKTIGKCLDSILSQDLPKKYEIIVSCPDKKTANVVKSYQRKNKKIKLVKDPGEGKPTALNIIFQKARGKYIILTDGDVVLGKDSIKKLFESFDNPNVGMVSGKVIYKINKNHLFYEWAKLSEEISHKIRLRRSEKGNLWHPTGYLYAIKNGVIEKIPKNALTDDAVIGYLIKSQGFRTKYEPKSKVFVKFPLTKKDFVTQKSRTRAGFLQIKNWFGFSNRNPKGELSIGFKDLIRFYKFRNIHKMLCMGVLYIISWFYAYWSIFTKKSFKNIWKRIETTK